MTIEVRLKRHLSKANFNKILILWPEYTSDFLDILAHSTYSLTPDFISRACNCMKNVQSILYEAIIVIQFILCPRNM